MRPLRTSPARQSSAGGRAVVVSLLIAALLAGCGSDDDNADGSATAESVAGDRSTTTAGPAVEGCDDALGDITTVSPADPPGYCEPGYPKPVPLDEPTTVELGISNTSIELFAGLLVGVHEGEFERENLRVNVNVVPTADATQLLADEQIDMIFSSPYAALYNAIDQGFNLRWVTGMVRQPEEIKSGLWVPRGLELSDLPGKTVASTVGRGSNAFLSLFDELKALDIDINEVEIQHIPSPQDAVTALQNGAVDGAYVTPPAYEVLEESGEFEFLLPQTPHAETVGGLIFGPSLLRDRATGEAVVRAYVRTLSTYFQGDYESNPDTVAMMADAMEVPAAAITNTAAFIHDYEMHRSTAGRMEELYAAFETLSYPFPERALGDEIVDRTFIEAVVGRQYR